MIEIHSCFSLSQTDGYHEPSSISIWFKVMSSSTSLWLLFPTELMLFVYTDAPMILLHIARHRFIFGNILSVYVNRIWLKHSDFRYLSQSNDNMSIYKCRTEMRRLHKREYSELLKSKNRRNREIAKMKLILISLFAMVAFVSARKYCVLRFNCNFFH